eukprot:6919542-Alexandrium_andersonii.AAC.1
MVQGAWAAEATYSKSETKFLTALKEALAQKDVGSRTALGQRFTRSLDEASLQDYRGLGTDSERRAFRLAWAEKETSRIKS